MRISNIAQARNAAHLYLNTMTQKRVHIPFYYIYEENLPLHAVIQFSLQQNCFPRRRSPKALERGEKPLILNLIIDTGATVSVIHQPYSIHLTPQEKGAISTAGIGDFRTQALLYHIEELFYANTRLPSLDCIALPLESIAQEVKANCGITIHGLLGSDYLIQNSATISYAQKRLSILLPQSEVSE